jgi:hypothetical protein
MREQILLDYFQGNATIEQLADDLKGAQKKTSYDTTTVFIDQIREKCSYKITKESLLRICEAVLSNKLPIEDVNTIAYAIFASEVFTFDEGDAVERVLWDWDNPDIGFPLTRDNMIKWKLLLERNEDTFDIRELKQKGKNG